MKLVYKPEIYPENILYIRDTPATRKILTENFGNLGKAIKYYRSFWYIKFDIIKSEWIPSLGHEWLYRDAPPLTTIEEILKEYVIDLK